MAMSNAASKEILSVQSVRISRIAETTTPATTARHEIAACSPRANVAYSFWLSWRWLKSKINNSSAKNRL
jgi:hypothetical protein